MAVPRKVSTPKMTRAPGMNTSVTAVTSAPAANTVTPRRSICRPKGAQKPDSRMNTQQMVCCHRRPGIPAYQSIQMPNRNIMSQQAWYSIMLTRSSPRSSSSRA